MPSSIGKLEPRMSAGGVRMHWPIAVCIICISCIAKVVGQTPQENVLGSNGDDNKIAFELPDITVMMQDDAEHELVVEAFKIVNNDRIFQELYTSPAKFSALLWVSAGHPIFVRSVDGRNSSNNRLFHEAEDEFYVKIQMLTQTHKSMLVNRAREMYGLNVTKEQFVLLPLTRFECKLMLSDSVGMRHMISGKVGNFKELPLRMDFKIPKQSMERNLFLSKLMDDSSTLGFDCVMSVGAKVTKTNTLIIESQQLEQIGLSDKLFGAAENVYVTRHQMSELAREMYSTLNIIEDYQMPEHTFSEAFIDGLISQLSSERFKNVPLDTAIRSLSRYTFDINRYLQPDVIRRNLSNIFKVVREDNKAHILAARENARSGSSENGMSATASVTAFGVGSVAASYAESSSMSHSSESKTLDDQLNELNQQSKNSIEWEIVGSRVIPKSLNVAKLTKARLSSRLTFSRVQFRSFYAPFSRSFTLYTRDAISAVPQLEQNSLDLVRRMVAAAEHRLNNKSDVLDRRIQSIIDQQRMSDMSLRRLELRVQELLTNNNHQSTTLECTATTRPRRLSGNGTLTSPGFPANYNNNGDCQWQLMSTHQSGSISFTIHEFVTESIHDELFLYDGSSSNASLIVSLSGNQSVPVTYTSTGRHMFIRFATDFSIVYQGFTATYESQDRRSEYAAAWAAFKHKFSKMYTEEQENYRHSMWLKHAKHILQHNREADQGLHKFRMDFHSHADLTVEEFRDQMLGDKTPTDFQLPSPYTFDNLTASDSIDWRKKGCVTAVKHQGYNPVCWSFAVTGVLEGQLAKNTGQLVSLSEQNLIDCIPMHEAYHTAQALDYACKNGGIDTEASYPFDERPGNPRACRFKASDVGVTCGGYGRVVPGDENALKKAVDSIGPIAISMIVYDSFNHYSSGLYRKKTVDNMTGHHAMLIVGYGTTPDGDDYWLVKNSWGLTWGMHGYIKVARNDNNMCNIANMAIFPTYVRVGPGVNMQPHGMLPPIGRT